jgi:hypothetical protein
VGDQLTGIRLLEAPLNLGHWEESLHGVPRSTIRSWSNTVSPEAARERLKKPKP